MSKENSSQLILEKLNREQETAKKQKVAFGWTNPSNERHRQLIHAVAQAATQEGLGTYSVTEFPLPTEVGEFRGVKIMDTKHTHLSEFWRLVDYAQNQLDGGTNPVTTKELTRAIQKTIADKLSGELDRIVSERDIRRFPLDLYDWER